MELEVFILFGTFGFFLFVLLRRKEETSQESDPLFGDHRDSYHLKIKAQSEAEIRALIDDLPSVAVKWVVDGDTVTIREGWSDVTIRLDSIDCPEDGQHWGDTAKFGLIKMIGRKRVRLEKHGRDDYGRTLATLYVWDDQKSEWMNVNERMVMLGHAWVMRRFYDHLPHDRQENLNRLERWAKSRQVGLWREENPVPPWQWRNGGKVERV